MMVMVMDGTERVLAVTVILILREVRANERVICLSCFVVCARVFLGRIVCKISDGPFQPERAVRH